MNLFRAFLLSLFYSHGRIPCHAMKSVDESLSFFHPSEHNVVIASILFHFPKIQTTSPADSLRN